MRQAVRAWGMAIINNKIWIPDITCNQLISYDLENNEAHREVIFKNFGPFKSGLYADVIEDNNKVVCIPTSADVIGIYDYVSKTIKELRIKEYNVPHSRFFSAINICGHIYMIPVRYPAIIEYYNNEIKYHTSWLKDWKQKMDVGHAEYFRNAVLVENEYLLMPSQQSNQVLAFNIKDKSHKYYEIGNENDTFWEIMYDGVDCWLTTRTGNKIIRWNMLTQEEVYYDQFPIECGDCEYEPFSGMIDIGECVIFLQCNSNYSIKLDKSTGEMNIIKALNTNPFLKGSETPKYVHGYMLNCSDAMIPSNTSDGGVAIYNVYTDEVEWKQIEADIDELIVQTMKNKIAENNYLIEEAGYLECLLKNHDKFFELKSQRNGNDSVGKIILKRTI
jgi:hypothetical protein